jgi:choline dehydrogenase-like flavoprotein
VLNYMQYVRGHSDDFDSWRLPGWRFSDLLPFFVKAEAQHRQEFAEADGIHGSSRPLHVSDHMQVHELTQAWVKSLANDGFRTQVDYNSPDQGGNRTASASQVTSLVIVLLSPHIRYPCLGDTAQRPAHLHGPRLPATSSHVTRVLFDANKGVRCSLLFSMPIAVDVQMQLPLAWNTVVTAAKCKS